MGGPKHHLLLYAAVHVCALVLCPASSLAGDPLAKPFIGVNYGPFHRDGQRPDAAAEISEEQIREDLQTITSAGFGWVRTYGLDHGLNRIVPLAHRLFPHLRFFMGAYVCGLDHDEVLDSRRTRSQLDEAIRLANQYRNVTGIVVGNECLAGEPEACPQPVTVEQLIEDLNYVKQGLNPEVRKTVVVTSALSMIAAVKNHDAQGRRVAEHCDVVMVNIHPFFASATAEQAVGSNVDGSYRRLSQLYAQPGKSIVIGETGWPSAGPSNGPAAPGLENEEKFTRDMFRYARSRGVSVFLFEMFDEPWKAEAGGVGPHWGLFDTHGRAKFALPW
jgi:exo-beta-1,3-glucanase (GH17 family)